MKLKNVNLLLIIIMLVSLLAGCGQKTKINTGEIKNFSEPMLESILTAADKDDYTSYSKDFSNKMKEAVNESNFKEMNKLIKEKIGNYESKQFVEAQTQGDYISAIYKAKYSNEPKDVMISITFNKDDETHKVEGLRMVSPKLAGK